MTNTTGPTPNQPAMRRPRRRGAGHVIAIIAGSMALLPGLGLVAGGTAVAIAQAVATDDDGYFHHTLDRIESDGVAINTGDLWLDDVDIDDDAEPWVLDHVDLDLRLRVDGARDTDEVFVGVARVADVEDYLSGARQSLVTDIHHHRAEYRQVEGRSTVEPPTDQDIWVASVDGPGEQELRWDARGGRWAVVVMNADGTSGVAADVEIGARSDALTPIAVALIVVGGVITLAGIALIVVGARGRRRPDSPIEDRPLFTGPQPGAPAGTTLPAPSPDTAVQLDDPVDPAAPTDTDVDRDVDRDQLTTVG